MKMKIVFLLFLLFLLNECVLFEKGHNYILFVNNSDDDVYVTPEYYYPDTIFHHRWSAISSNQYQTKVYAKTSSNRPLLFYYGDTWEMEFHTAIKSDTLIVFVLNVDSIERWENIDYKLNYNPDDAVIKRYYLSLGDLKVKDWTIIYP